MTESSIEFVVGVDAKSNVVRFYRLPITKQLGSQLREMLTDTEKRMSKLTSTPFAVDRVFDTKMVCVLERNDDYTGAYYSDFMEVINDAVNLPLFDGELDKSASIYGLIERTENDGFRLGLRRRKFITRSAKKTFLSVNGHTLKELSEKVFYLDNDFECIVEDGRILSIGSGIIFKLLNLGDAIDRLFPENVAKIEAEQPGIDLSSLKAMTGSIRRIATLAMRIVTTEEHKSWGQDKFRESLEASGIEIKTSSEERVGPAEGHEYDFLRVVAKNIYRIEVDDGTYEVREATHSQTFQRQGR